MNRYSQSQLAVWCRSPLGMIALIALLVLALYLLTEHTAHVLAVLPFGIILLCPLMHMFMHGGHGGGGRHDTSAQDPGEATRV